jgi:dienelactone hydrolase
MAQCCPTDLPKVVSDYAFQGREETVQVPGGEPLTVFRNGSGDKLLILIPDIFGCQAQSKQVVDVLSAAGLNVALVDVFRGEPWDGPLGPELVPWIQTHSLDAHVGADLAAAKKHVASTAGPSAKCGLLGFCWGADPAMLLAAGDEYAASGGAHPSFINPEKASKVRCPFLLIPTKDDHMTMTGIKEALDTTPVASACEIRAYEDMFHGFMASRADFSNPEVRGLRIFRPALGALRAQTRPDPRACSERRGVQRGAAACGRVL